MGVNGRGMAHVSAFAAASNMQVTHLVDVDSQVLRTRGGEVATKVWPDEVGHDYRRVLDNRSVDILSVATPDHLCTQERRSMPCRPASTSILEKPLRFAPSEGEAADRAAQQRSGLGPCKWAISSAAVRDLSRPSCRLVRDGLLGEIYAADTWYANNRKSIGVGVDGDAAAQISIGTFGKAPGRGAPPIAAMSFTTTGTGSGTGAPANCATTPCMRWTSPAG